MAVLSLCILIVVGSCMLLACFSAAATVGVSTTIINPDNIPSDYRLSTIRKESVYDSEKTNDTAKYITKYDGEITHL